MITKQKLIDSGIPENAIADIRCQKCNGYLVGQKNNTLVCADCATSYKVKA